ncbi:hypothetical protein Ddc_05845 [Ditylenchus destructor]|nr:hypothetical protein Ddc_05845 [Ditylenchus destructor]
MERDQYNTKDFKVNNPNIEYLFNPSELSFKIARLANRRWKGREKLEKSARQKSEKTGCRQTKEYKLPLFWQKKEKPEIGSSRESGWPKSTNFLRLPRPTSNQRRGSGVFAEGAYEVKQPIEQARTTVGTGKGEEKVMITPFSRLSFPIPTESYLGHGLLMLLFNGVRMGKYVVVAVLLTPENS